MKLKEFNDLYSDKAIHCKTEELANEFLELADSLGYKWRSGSNLTSRNEWHVCADKTFYKISNKKYIFYGNVNNTDLPIIEFKGENKMKLKDLMQGMICKLRNGESITIVNKGVFFRRTFGIYTLEEKYNEDLTHKQHKYLDIMEITYGNEVVFKRNESRWFVPEVGERYYFTRSYGDVDAYTNTGDKVDNEIFNTVKVFKTEEEVDKMLRKQQATLSVERWIAENDVEVDFEDFENNKYSVQYNIRDKKLVVDYFQFLMSSPKQFILSSQEKAEQLIKEREKELKIMFGVEE